LIKGTKSLEAENNEIAGTIQSVREKLRIIQEKYHRNQKSHISAKDKLILKKLRKEESVLASKQLKITNKLESDERKKKSLWKFISWILKMLTPFRVAIGVVCLKISLLIVYSMMITNIDRLINSECGYKCGYLLEQSPSYFNPLDSLLKILSNHHENFYSVQLFLDTTVFAIILLYTFICILYGIVKIGINFFSIDIYRIKRRDTMP
jgi:LMBR1 domain-containing protein 1